MDLRELNFGIEIETVGRERELIARAVREIVGGVISHVGDTFYVVLSSTQRRLC